LQDEVVEIQHFAELGGEALAMRQVGDAQRAPRHLVLVRRPDAAPGRADRRGALGVLPREVERHVRRNDQRAGRADADPFGDRHAPGDQLVHLSEQRVGGQHDAVADQAGDAVAQDAGRQQPHDGLLALDDQRVPGVVAALETHHGRHPVGEEIYDLALALVTPLGADDDDVLPHAQEFLPAARSGTHEPQQQQAGDHADESREPQLFVRHLGQHRHRAARAARVREWQQALDDHQQRDRRQQISPVHRAAGRSGLAAAHRVLQVAEELTLGLDDEHVLAPAD
jgi:hypothetical protein